MTEPKLKPCPFCGGKVNLSNMNGTVTLGKKHWCVVCWDCCLFFAYDLTYGGLHTTKQGCADDWNKRVVQNDSM